MKLAIFIVGFDEKLVIRAGFRIGLQPGDAALLVYSLSGGDYDRQKVSNAVNLVKNIFSSAGVAVKELVVNANNFGRDVSSLVSVLKELKPERLVVSLGSGMRYLGLVAVYASLIYRELVKGVELVVHVAREDGFYDVTLNLDTMRLSVGRSELRILCLVGDGVKRDLVVKEACDRMEKSPSTIYMLLHRMVKRGLVQLRDDVVVLTPLGEALSRVFCGGEG
ncbi:MAG: CRISPR-associated CARF protein Csa3 [Desulfurococcus sp.]|uniref:CRISPR-associated CARF protein Csa3 n=1 Tax=Desulfurococcus sp. TaxID=51678 RepID=UPI003171733B